MRSVQYLRFQLVASQVPGESTSQGPTRRCTLCVRSIFSASLPSRILLFLAFLTLTITHVSGSIWIPTSSSPNRCQGTVIMTEHKKTAASTLFLQRSRRSHENNRSRIKHLAPCLCHQVEAFSGILLPWYGAAAGAVMLRTCCEKCLVSTASYLLRRGRMTIALFGHYQLNFRL